MMGILSKLFGREADAGPVGASSLPSIPRENLGEHFGNEPAGEIAGPGAAAQKRGAEAWNNQDYKAALRLYLEVVELGLDEDYDMSLMHQTLGCCYFHLDDLSRSVEHFLKCLAYRDRAPTGAWQSAMYLYYIYDEARRTEEATALRRLADALNRTVVWRHEPSLEHDVRAFARRSGAV